MKKTRRTGRAALCFLLTMTLLAGLAAFQAGATAADDQEKELLGTLSKKYEASSPGAISSGSGDAGGKSYGSYQFSSGSNIPKLFFEWCQNSDDTYYQSIGDRLSEAYYDGGAGYGSSFDAEWKALAKENAAGFEQAQRNYVRQRYYDPIVRRVERDFPGFDIDNYSIALRNVLWSRAVQLGVGGAATMMEGAMNMLGGFANQPEAEIIRAIYADCAEVRDPKNSREDVMYGSTAEKYGVDGKVLGWFSGSSGDVQLGVYMRLAFNEPAVAQQMLANYGYADAPLDEGMYRFIPALASHLAMASSDNAAILRFAMETDPQQFRLTYYASGYYIITDQSTGRRLTASTDGSLTFTDPGTDNAQMWKIENYYSGFSVKNRSTGQYLCAGTDAADGSKISVSSEAYQWQLIKGSAFWTLEGGVYPTYSSMLSEDNASFPLLGTLRCSYPIQTVKIQVLDGSGANAVTPASASDINAKSYNLSRLDDKISFGSLNAGAYTLVISATSSASSGNPFRLESPFYVSNGSYMVFFDACGGTVELTGKEVSAGQTYGDLPEAVRPGYIFMGWYTAPEGGTLIASTDTTPADNVALYAHYEKALSYTFRNHDGTAFVYGELLPGQPIPLPEDAPMRPADESFYYTFTGWTGYTEGMTISADIAFEPQFTAHAKESSGISTDAYLITDNILHAVSTGTTVAQMQQNLSPSEHVIIHQGMAAPTKLVGTGMTVEYVADDETVQTLTVVVTGDTNGDGQCTVTDMVQLQSHLLGKNTLSGAALQAADISGDGACTITDMVQITSALLGRNPIQPN